eukprot:2926118-Pleurochrysis_carterae.AAC.2
MKKQLHSSECAAASAIGEQMRASTMCAWCSAQRNQVASHDRPVLPFLTVCIWPLGTGGL